VFANIESGRHEILLTNLDMCIICNFTRICLCRNSDMLCYSDNCMLFVPCTVRSQFTSLNQQNSLSIASSQHSTNKTHYVLPLIFILNVTLIRVSIHMESSSGNMYQTLLHHHHHHHPFIFHFIQLQVQPMDMEIVIKYYTMYLLNYRCQMTEYSYNTMIT